MSVSPSDHITEVIFGSIEQAKEGYGVFDTNDDLIFCNESFANIFGLSKDRAVGMSFTNIIKHSFEQPDGLNISSADLTEWLAIANKKRRSQSFRSFDTDRKDNRWFRISEQVVQDNSLFLHCADITEIKQNEFELKKVSDNLYQLATVDFLTKINNRRHFYQLCGIEKERCQRHGKTFSFMMLDIDHFKNINDSFGHQAGDSVLKAFVDNAKLFLRDYDIFGRVGGEEFAVLLPETDLQKSIGIANRIKENTQSLKIDYQGEPIGITISIGLVEKSDNAQSLDDLSFIADKKLYQAKNEGRNLIRF